ncbi:unnamed protein product [Adineta steineri]|uniref:UBC core domain-containing protein n=1 Tax=Adineta steineri TaxID=433720 RepID=A0A819FIL6_9BILA|nr:unnamed protein product [Adineta steineri]
MYNPYVTSYFYYDGFKKDENDENIIIHGYLLPRTEPYKRGSYKVRITLCQKYPFKRPKMELLTIIYHPSVRINNQELLYCYGCCERLWMPYETKCYCILNGEAMRLFGQDRSAYEAKALEMVMKYSCSRPNSPIFSLKSAVKQIICKKLNFDQKRMNQLPISNRLKKYLNPLMKLN